MLIALFETLREALWSICSGKFQNNQTNCLISILIYSSRTAPARAKSDLQKQLVARGVRKSIANAILSGIGLAGAEPEPSSSARPVSRVDRPISVMSSRSRAPVDVHDDGMFFNIVPR